MIFSTRPSHFLVGNNANNLIQPEPSSSQNNPGSSAQLTMKVNSLRSNTNTHVGQE